MVAPSLRMLSGDAHKILQWTYMNHGLLLELIFNVNHYLLEWPRNYNNHNSHQCNCNHKYNNHNYNDYNLHQCNCNNNNNNHCSLYNAIHHNNHLSSNASTYNHHIHHGANPVDTTGPQQEGTVLVVDPTQQISSVVSSQP